MPHSLVYDRAASPFSKGGLRGVSAASGFPPVILKSRHIIKSPHAPLFQRGDNIVGACEDHS